MLAAHLPHFSQRAPSSATDRVADSASCAGAEVLGSLIAFSTPSRENAFSNFSDSNILCGDQTPVCLYRFLDRGSASESSKRQDSFHMEGVCTELSADRNQVPSPHLAH